MNFASRHPKLSYALAQGIGFAAFTSLVVGAAVVGQELRCSGFFARVSDEQAAANRAAIVSGDIETITFRPSAAASGTTIQVAVPNDGDAALVRHGPEIRDLRAKLDRPLF